MYGIVSEWGRAKWWKEINFCDGSCEFICLKREKKLDFIDCLLRYKIQTAHDKKNQK